VVSDTREVDATLILGRPFLVTTSANIDVKHGSLTLKVGEDSVTFRLKDGLENALEDPEQL
ncbi:hypothetical protein LINPERPRIM_LOCUS14968, partial [Linum perenne]